MSKRSRLNELVEKRRNAQRDGYRRIGDYFDGAYECDFVSPYTQVAGNLDSEVVFVLQDWASDDFLGAGTEPDQNSMEIGRSPGRATNVNLDALILEHFGRSIEEVYVTNLFPLVKPGSMNAPIPRKDLDWAAREFTWPEIEVIQPQKVVCLGQKAFNALYRLTTGKKSWPTMKQAIESLSPTEHQGVELWCQAHPGGMGISNRGGWDAVHRDWNRMSG